MSPIARRLLKFALYAFAILVILLGIGISATIGWRPFLGPAARAVTPRRFEATPQRLERGKYLVQGLAVCTGCHSTWDMQAKPQPVVISAEGAGRVFLDRGSFRVITPNITSDPTHGLGNWSDDEIARAIREGVSRDGHALFPIMPYRAYSAMSDEDLASVVVYLRTLPPVAASLGRTQLPFPLSRLINAAPRPVEQPVPPPPAATPVERGRYAVEVLADCAGCHSPRDQRGQPIPGMAFSGGNTFGKEGEDFAASSNLTPDASGISYYDEALFLQAMKQGKVGGRAITPHMPFWFFQRLKDDDLKDMFAYLRTVPAVRHRVDNSEPLTLCKLCNQRHGAGDRN